MDAAAAPVLAEHEAALTNPGDFEEGPESFVMDCHPKDVIVVLVSPKMTYGTCIKLRDALRAVVSPMEVVVVSKNIGMFRISQVSDNKMAALLEGEL